MAQALAQRGIELVHVIGPGTGHQYHPAARDEVERRMDQLARRGRNRYPRSVVLETYTLKYNRMHWLTIDALGEHWKHARVAARLEPEAGKVAIDAENVTALSLDFGPGSSPFEPGRPVKIEVGGTSLTGPPLRSDLSWTCRIHRDGDTWSIGPRPESGPRKRHDLQGPIDDAFMDSFVFVLPTGQGGHESVNSWVERESRRAIVEWRRQFRGEPRVKKDVEVTEADIASCNLVLWGDPASNPVLKRLADQLPIGWKPGSIDVADRRFDAAHHALVLIQPNPLNPSRYVVLNSGFTYREYDYLNNARQVPKLPDWAVIDTDGQSSGPSLPGKVVAADFFDESWRLRSARDE